MVYVNQCNRRYKFGNDGFALIETFDGVWEVTDVPNSELEGMAPEGEEKPKRRTKKEGS